MNRIDRDVESLESAQGSRISDIRLRTFREERSWQTHAGRLPNMSTTSSQAEMSQSPTTSSRRLSNPDTAFRPSCLLEHRGFTAISNLSRLGNEIKSSVTCSKSDISRVSVRSEVVSLTSDQDNKLFRMVKSVIFRKAVPTIPSSGITSRGNRE